MSKRRSSEEWSKLLSDYEKRECTQEQFCRENGFSSATLQYHLERRNRARGFITAVSKKEESAMVSVEFPGGIRLLIRS